jgi:hypothetical protein
VHDHKFLQASHLVLGSFLEAIVEVSGLEFSYELFPINLAIVVFVDSSHDLVNLSGTEAEVELPYGVSKLILADGPIAVLVKLLEDVLEALARRSNYLPKLLYDISLPLRI